MSKGVSEIPVTLPSKIDRASANSKAGLIALQAKQAAIIEAFDLDELLTLQASGATLKEMSAALGCNYGSLSVWINQQTGDKAEKIAAARRASAGASMDRALQELDDARTAAKNGEPVPVQLAKELARHHEKRAALSNTRFNERAALHLNDTPAATAVAPSFRINIISNGAPQTVTIDQQPDDDTSLI
jgi:hypothetical protein